MQDVYDDEKQKTNGPETDGSSDNLEDSYKAPSSTNPGSERAKDAGTLAGLEDSFSGPDSTESGSAKLAGESSLYNPAGGEKSGFTSRAMGFMGKHKKGIGIGGGVGGTLTGIMIAAFLALLPLKIVSMVENLQNKYFANPNSAVQNESVHLLENYERRYVFPRLGVNGCTTTIDKGCSFPVAGETKVSRLYRSWSEARLENKMATKYGIEISKDVKTGKFFIKTPQTSGEGVDISAFADGHVASLDDVPGASRAEIRQAYKSALEGETFMTKVWLRLKFGNLLERKYGVRRCIVFCKVTDPIAGKFDELKGGVTAFQSELIDRVITPHSQVLGDTMKMLLGLGPGNTTVNDGTNGQPQEDALQAKAQQDLTEQAANTVNKTAATLESEAVAAQAPVADAVANGIEVTTPALFEKASQTVEDKITNTAGSDIIPVVGQVKFIVDVTTTAASVAQTTGNAAKTLKKAEFVVTLPAMIKFYMMYRSLADEAKAGKVSAKTLGSFTDALGSNTKNGEPAESSPLYNQLFGTGTATGKYTCDNGKQIASGKSACPEESLIPRNSISKFNDVMSNPPLSQLIQAADAWNGTVGKLDNTINGFVGKAVNFVLTHPNPIDPTGRAFNAEKDFYSSLASKYFKKYLFSVMQWLIPSPISTKMSGARSFNVMAAGADGAAYTGCQALGCQVVSQKQSAAIQTAYFNDQKQEFQQKPMFARLFDTGTSLSLISRLAMAMPTDRGSMLQDFSSILTKPLHITSLFGSLFSRPALAADSTTGADPFGIPTLGYPTNNAAFKADPESFTDEVCTQINKVWYANDTGPVTINGIVVRGMVEDDNTGQLVNTTSNPCLLIDSAVGAAGGFYDSSLLGADSAAGNGAQQ